MHRQTAIFQWCLEAFPRRCRAALAGARPAALPRSAGVGEGPAFVPGAKVVLGPILSRIASVRVRKLISLGLEIKQWRLEIELGNLEIEQGDASRHALKNCRLFTRHSHVSKSTKLMKIP